MTHHETLEQSAPSTLPSWTIRELEAWDWRAALKRDERSYAWLARKTDRSTGAVEKYATGERRAPLEWLERAARALGEIA